MLFWLKKTLTIPLLPFGFAMITGTLGVLLIWSKKYNRHGRILLTLAFVALLVFSNKGVALALISPLEGKYPPIPEIKHASETPAELKECVAIIVLGGGHGTSEALSPLHRLVPAGLSRISEGVRLARLLPHATVITSGHHTPGPTHAKVLADAAISLGVAPERFVLFESARDTEDEISELARYSQGRPVAVVTSAWHMPRTMQLCAAYNVRAVPCPTDFMAKPGADAGMGLLAWDIPALDRSSRAIREHIGHLWNALRGR